MLNTVAENLEICEGMLQRWIVEAMAIRDKKHANEFHVHLAMLFASQSKPVLFVARAIPIQRVQNLIRMC